jgi:hypothetical protein
MTAAEAPARLFHVVIKNIVVSFVTRYNRAAAVQDDTDYISAPAGGQDDTDYKTYPACSDVLETFVGSAPAG